MKFVRYQKAGETNWGMLEGDVISALAGAPWVTREPTGEQTLIDEVSLLPPAEPGNIFCVGLNYADHAEESGTPMPEEPNIFLKGVNSLLGHEGTIIIPPGRGGSTTRGRWRWSSAKGAGTSPKKRPGT